jgi:hypothetical protein
VHVRNAGERANVLGVLLELFRVFNCGFVQSVEGFPQFLLLLAGHFSLPFDARSLKAKFVVKAY